VLIKNLNEIKEISYKKTDIYSLGPQIHSQRRTEKNRLMSIDLKNSKKKPLQPFLLPSSIMNIKNPTTTTERVTTIQLNSGSEKGAASIF
jgi:hypothetical protein